MCFSSNKQETTPTPAPAPAPPAPLVEQIEVGAPRRAEDEANHGDDDAPDTRVDRPNRRGSGLTGRPGAGVRM
jgi:hypothetical protein